MSPSRLIATIALICVALLGFTATAGAVYKGFTPINPDNTVAGYLAFGDAQAIMIANGVDPGLAATAHGGYITTTTKCVVCHSAHRATGIPEGVPSATNQLYLTSGGDSCTVCHTASGAQSNDMLVEWGPKGGPHASKGCTQCHKAGIHGLGGSEFHVMNVFLLGKFNDQQIKDEAQYLAAGPNGSFYVPPALTGGTDYNPAGGAATVTNTWWLDGGASVNNGVRIGAPTQIGGLPGEVPGAASRVDAPSYSAARSLATNYTCSQAGCHVNSAMLNMNWGTGFIRDADKTGDGVMVTAHALPSITRTSGAWNGNPDAPKTSSCGPCHPGNPAGFPTADFSISRYAYGCDQCHDAVGVATNSTAWPHGNRDIKIYEWIDNGDGTQTETSMTAAKGNLWMYGGSIALRNNGSFDPANPFANAASPNGALGATSAFADLNWRLLTGLVTPTSVADTVAEAETNPGYSGLTDGSCIKCHVPVDSASLEAMGAAPATALRGTWGNSFSHAFDASGNTTSNSQKIFIFR